MEPHKALSTAQIMKEYQVTRNALRLYEEMGLLVKIDRTDSGYRRFTDKDLEDLNFILAAKSSGFTLNEIKDFLKIARTAQTLNCKTVSTELTK
jgi:MerR family Zn(II)-responsive transcriptional regulator of zntA